MLRSAQRSIPAHSHSVMPSQAFQPVSCHAECSTASRDESSKGSGVTVHQSGTSDASIDVGMAELADLKSARPCGHGGSPPSRTTNSIVYNSTTFAVFSDCAQTTQISQCSLWGFISLPDLTVKISDRNDAKGIAKKQLLGS